RALELADPAEEAQAIALALRGALEEPGRTAALVTPDRNLARRVSAHLRRWGIEADDSAGRPLALAPAGTLLLAAAAWAAARFEARYPRGRAISSGRGRRAGRRRNCCPIMRMRRGRGRRGSTQLSCRFCSSGCSPPRRRGPLTASIRGCSSGACWRRGCSMP